MVSGAVLIIIFIPNLSAQRRSEPASVNLCDVFSSPAKYNHNELSVEGIITPSFHSVFLSSPSCKSEKDADFTTQAVLPSSWESLPNGKELRKFLRRGKSARVKLIGMFEADAERYGPDGARFRFVISGISSVAKAPPDFHL